MPMMASPRLKATPVEMCNENRAIELGLLDGLESGHADGVLVFWDVLRGVSSPSIQTIIVCTANGQGFVCVVA